MSEAGRRAIVLSSGDSRRMGRPKALLTLGAESFLARIDREFRAAGFDSVTVVVGGRHAAEIQSAASELGIEVVSNADPSEGPISSVRCALRHCPVADVYAIHPVDIPAVEASDIRTLLAAAEDCPGDVWIPSIERRRAHPVLFRRSVVERILALPTGKTLRDVWSNPALSINHVELDNRWLRFDVDTLEDYQALQRDWVAR